MCAEQPYPNLTIPEQVTDIDLANVRPNARKCRWVGPSCDFWVYVACGQVIVGSSWEPDPTTRQQPDRLL